jgi:hypothetical protein
MDLGFDFVAILAANSLSPSLPYFIQAGPIVIKHFVRNLRIFVIR